MEVVQGVITSSGFIWLFSCQTADRVQARPVLQLNSGKKKKKERKKTYITDRHLQVLLWILNYQEYVTGWEKYFK